MPLRAGIVSVDITPPDGTPLFGYPRVKRVSGGVHDPLNVTAFHLRNGVSGVVIVAFDLFSLAPTLLAEIRTAISVAVGLSEDNVLVSCTGTHSGPSTETFTCWSHADGAPAPDPDYVKHLHERAVDAAAHASAMTQPAEYAWTSAEVQLEDRTEDIGILAVRKQGGGEMIAAILMAGLMPDALGPGFSEVSADLPGFVREELSEDFGEEFGILYLTAPCCDQPFPYVDGDAVERTEATATAVADAVRERLSDVDDLTFHDEAVMRGSRKKVNAPLRTFPGLWEAQGVWGDSRAKYQQLEKQGAPRSQLLAAADKVTECEATVTYSRLQQSGRLDATVAPYRTPEVHVLRIGDHGLAGFPCALASDYGHRIREANSDIWPVSLVCGNMQGNIVTAEAEKAGDFSVLNSPFAAASGELLVEAALAEMGS
jgi:hypothetical protein